MTTIDMDAHYTVRGYGGVAFYLAGWAKGHTDEEWVLDCDNDHPGEHDESCYLYSEPEEYDRDDMVVAVMVGDDREHLIDVDDLTILDDDGYCSECGQTGCGWGR